MTLGRASLRLKGGILAVGVVGKGKFEGLGGGRVLGGDGEGGGFMFEGVVGEGVEEVEEVGDLIFAEAEVAKVIVVDGFGGVGDAPAFGFEIALVVEFEDVAKSPKRAVVKVGGGEFDVAEAGGAEFPEVLRVTGDGEEAGIFLAEGGGTEVVVAEVGEEGLGPVLRFEEVAIGTAGGGAVEIEAALLGEGEGLLVAGLVAVKGGIEGAEGGRFQELDEGSKGVVGEVVIVEENVRRKGPEVGFVSKTVCEFGCIFQGHFVSLEEGLADLGKEVFGPAIMKKATFPGKDFGTIREEDVFVCEGWDERGIHEGRSVAGPFEEWIGPS